MGNRMDRRGFIFSSGVAAAALMNPGGAEAKPQPPAKGGAAGKPFLMKLGCQSPPSSDEHFAYFARFGIRNICARANVAQGQLTPSLDELHHLKDMAERHGLSLDMLQPELLPSSHIDVEPHPAIMMADSAERDRDIEAFQNTVRNAGRAGIPCIKYNMSLLGVLRTGTIPGRGDVRDIVWDYAKAVPAKPLTRAGVVDADRFWERITYFLDRVVPVAEEYKVRIACHPQDPGLPPQGYQGISQVLGTIDGLKRFVGIRESRFHGLNFCQGVISEDLEDPATQVFDVIRWFGTRGKIFNVHFRNIRGHRDAFEEVFPDEGDVDLVRALQTYREVGYDGMIMPDHVPIVPGKDGGEDPNGKLQNFAFCYGYIRGLLQSAARLT